MKVLLTAFGPFGTFPVNSSMEVLERLCFATEPYEVCKELLPVEFNGSVEAACRAVEHNKPDIVLCLGMAAKRGEICLERRAVNLAHARGADNAGYKPQNCKIVADGPEWLYTRVDVDSLCCDLRQDGVLCHVSGSAGSFVCNYLYYNLLYQFPEVPVLFVHLPSPATMAVRLMATAVRQIIVGLIFQSGGLNT